MYWLAIAAVVLLLFIWDAVRTLGGNVRRLLDERPPKQEDRQQQFPYQELRSDLSNIKRSLEHINRSLGQLQDKLAPYEPDDWDMTGKDE